MCTSNSEYAEHDASFVPSAAVPRIQPLLRCKYEDESSPSFPLPALPASVLCHSPSFVTSDQAYDLGVTDDIGTVARLVTDAQDIETVIQRATESNYYVVKTTEDRSPASNLQRRSTG